MKVAVITGIFGLAAAITAGVFGIATDLFDHGDKSSAGPEVIFYPPGPGYPPIAAKSPLELSGMVKGLPSGHKLYIVSRTGGGAFFIVKGTRSSNARSFAAADGDGPWGARDGGVGSATDKSGTTFVFSPYDADQDCADTLDGAGNASPQHSIEAMPTGCKPLKPEATVNLK